MPRDISCLFLLSGLPVGYFFVVKQDFLRFFIGGYGIVLMNVREYGFFVLFFKNLPEEGGLGFNV